MYQVYFAVSSSTCNPYDATIGRPEHIITVIIILITILTIIVINLQYLLLQ